MSTPSASEAATAQKVGRGNSPSIVGLRRGEKSKESEERGIEEQEE